MDIFVIIGVLLANLLVLFGIVFDNATMSLNFGNITQFINYPSIAITVGGTIAVLMISYPAKFFAKIPKHIKLIFFPTKFDPKNYIAEIVDYAKDARMKGLLSLEEKVAEEKDPTLKNGLMLVVDSVDPEKVKAILQSELDNLDERHTQDRGFYEKGAALAPAFGMVGTLVGLVLMLSNMADPTAIGPAMGTALLTTLYGSMLANMFFQPIANKLQYIHEQEFLCKTLISVGVEAIQAGENPKFIAEKLSQLLPTSARGDIDESGEGGGGDKADKKSKKKKK